MTNVPKRISANAGGCVFADEERIPKSQPPLPRACVAPQRPPLSRNPREFTPAQQTCPAKTTFYQRFCAVIRRIINTAPTD